MTQTKISTSLEAIVAHTIFRLRRDLVTTSYRDRLAIELLADRSTFAFQLLEMLVGESGINVILRRVGSRIAEYPAQEKDTPEGHYREIFDRIGGALDTPCLSTVHILHFIASDSDTAIAAELRNYGILPEDIDVALKRLTT
ncbi:MAG: hypothetical protein J6J64_01700 [Alistipes sp.]|nr:hypothetical protein [Alistipes sp.]